MAVFIKFGEVVGDATLEENEGFIAADNFVWSGDRTAGGHQQRGGRVHYAEAVFQKRADKASVPLLDAFNKNVESDTVEVRMTNAGKEEQGNRDLVIKFREALILKFRYVFSEAVLLEEITFDFSEYEVTFYDEEAGGGNQSTSDSLR